MSKFSCNTIKDILPLYVDEVVSDDTRSIVSEHLAHCENCRKRYESMKSEVSIPIENSAKPLKQFKHAWKRKKIVLVCSTVILTVAILVAAMALWAPVIFQRGNPVPYLLASTKISDETPYVQVDVDDQASIYISRLGPCPELIEYVEESKNFEFQEQGGGSYFFTNGADTLIVSSEVYLGKYIVWEVPNETFAVNQSIGTDNPT